MASSPCPHFDHHDTSLQGDQLYAVYEQLRRQRVCRSEANGGFWIVSRYDDVRAALKDNETFASGEGVFLPPLPGPRALGLETDPPAHGPYRRLFLDLVGRPRVTAAEPLLREMVDRVVGEFAAAGGGDAVPAISEKVPVEGIALMAGLSPETAAQVRALTVEMWKTLATDPNAIGPLMGLLMGEVEQRRGQGGEDFLTLLTEERIEGRPLSQEEIGNVLLSGVIAGHETTMNASTNLILELASDRALQERLRADRSLIPAAVEEVLRHRAPVHLFFRTVTRDVEFAGTAMQAGDKLAVLYASANRDPDRFECPAELDVDRADPGAHVSFGWGIHRCVGAPLAQAELRMLTDALLSRGTLELAGEPEPSALEGGHHMGWHCLPVNLF
ncbi:MAG TPA: cytochrome P450 [Solirubrobacterales bacterium]